MLLFADPVTEGLRLARETGQQAAAGYFSPDPAGRDR
jgi:hypothetical protein